MKIIDKDSICFLSEMGHNRFLYPNKNYHNVIRGGSPIRLLPWVGIGDLKAVEVDTSCLEDSKNINTQKLVVWIRKKEYDRWQ